MNKKAAAIISAGAVLTAAWLGHRSSRQHPREAIWYAARATPSSTPPAALVGTAWTGLDILLGISGARLLAAPSSRNRSVALLFWLVNVAGSAGYPWMFFKQRRFGTSAVIAAGMLASARAAAASAGKVDFLAAMTAMPLVGWLAFAGVLGEKLWGRSALLDRD